MDRYPISVIIPTYNRLKLLFRAIASVNRQTAECSEIIIVDDGSTDFTIEFLKRLLPASRTPIHIEQQLNKGPAAARNCGIKCAKNEYIAFLDSDDHWHKKKIEIQYRALRENPEFLISHTKEKWLRRGKHLNQKKKHIPRHGDIFDHCLQLCAVGMSTVMAKRELFDKVGFFDETLRCCEDYDFWLRVSCRFPFYLVDLPLTVKEGGRDDQVSVIHRVGMDKKRIYAIKKVIDSKVLEEKQKALAIEEFCRKCSVYGKGCLKHGRITTGEYYLELAKSYKEFH